MEMGVVLKDTSWWVFTLPALVGSDRLLDLYVVASLLLAFVSVGILAWALSPGGSAWREGRARVGRVAIPGVRGLPVLGSLLTLSGGLAHRSLAAAAWSKADRRQLMAFSLGQTPAVVASDPVTAREVLTSPHFADRPLKQSARSLMFGRAIGFAPSGTYWRLLRRISASHLFSPKRISAHEPGRQLDCTRMIKDIATEQVALGHVSLRKHLQLAALNNIMGSVFGKRYDPSLDGSEMSELSWMVREGFELLGAFNWSDHLPWLSYIYDPHRISERCSKLVPLVRSFVRAIVDEHRARMGSENLSDGSDFVDVLLSLGGDEKLHEDDMVAVLWEMIFRGTDTTALLTEWVMAELVLHPEVQRRLQTDLDCAALGNCTLTDSDVAKLPYLQAVVKETLRLHPPGPLLSWARLSTSDVNLSNGMVVPAHTTAMVNMWAITHDATVWSDPLDFNPDRFMEADVDVRGGDLRLAPFGAGRRVCPGKNMGLVTVTRWVAELAYRFEWVAEPGYHPVDLSEVLKLSCEMKHPLQAIALPRNN